MNITMPTRRTWLALGAALLLAAAAFGSLSNVASAADVKVTLSGDQEVPPVKSAGTGTGSFTIDANGLVHGSVTTKGITGTAAHIHMAPAGQNGPVVIPLEKKGDTYTTPENARLTAEQMAAFKAGKLYVNVHTAAHPDGEMRAQLKP